MEIATLVGKAKNKDSEFTFVSFLQSKKDKTAKFNKVVVDDWKNEIKRNNVILMLA